MNRRMAVLPTSQLGEPVIRAAASPVEDITGADAQAVIADLIESMRASSLVGMAAPQIGKGVRIFVSEIRSTIFRHKPEVEFDEVRVFVNPEIIRKSEEIVFGYEGCGSVAHSGLFAKVPRPSSVIVRAQDADGKEFELEADGLLARIIQHEIDHLDGKVFLDRLEAMDTVIGREAYIEMNKK